MWDLIVSVPDHCLSFYFSTSLFAVITTDVPTATVKDFIKLPVFEQSSGRDLINFWHSLAGMFAETTLS